MAKRFFPAGATVAIALLAGCVPRPSVPPPAPPPPAPPPAPPPPASAVAWEDATLSPGDWTYRDEGGASSALYGSGQAADFVLRCERSREISLVRRGVAGSALTLRTSFGDRTLPASAQTEGLVSRLAASDPVLDQIVFSRGRFAVDAAGAQRLVLPAWPEPARVIEDCRG